MPYTYQLLPEQNLSYVTASGRVAAAEVLQTTRQLFGDPDWRPGIDQIIDGSGATGLAITLPELHALLALERENLHRLGRGKLAIVAPEYIAHAICTLYARLAAMKRHPQVIEVFWSVPDAARWIGVDTTVLRSSLGHAA